MKIRLTRKQIATWLRNEPPERLIAGLWIDGDFLSSESISLLRKEPSSFKCAVSAIMQNALSQRSSLRSLKQACDRVIDHDLVVVRAMTRRARRPAGIMAAARGLRDKPLAALMYLSDVLVQRIDRYSRRRPRRLAAVVTTLVAFVEKYFPPSIVVDIGRARPAKGIKVVVEKKIAVAMARGRSTRR